MKEKLFKVKLFFRTRVCAYVVLAEDESSAINKVREYLGDTDTEMEARAFNKDLVAIY